MGGINLYDKIFLPLQNKFQRDNVIRCHIVRGTGGCEFFSNSWCDHFLEENSLVWWEFGGHSVLIKQFSLFELYILIVLRFKITAENPFSGWFYIT